MKPPPGSFLPRASKASCSSAAAEGAYVAVASGKAAWVKPFPVKAIDTVPPATASTAHSPSRCSKGNDPWAAARFANAAAAISVTRHGAQASMPSRAEVDAFLANTHDPMLHP